jgi:hypothetical protein
MKIGRQVDIQKGRQADRQIYIYTGRLADE